MSKQLVQRKSYTLPPFLLLFPRPRAMLILLLLLVTLTVFIVVMFAPILHCHHHHQMFIISVSADHYWHHVRHHHCYRRKLLTSWPPSPLLLWTITDTASVITAFAVGHYNPTSVFTTVAVGHYLHHVRHQHCCCGPLLTPCPSSPLLLWAIIDTMSVINTDLLVVMTKVIMYHYWLHVCHHHCCF